MTPKIDQKRGHEQERRGKQSGPGKNQKFKAVKGESPADVLRRGGDNSMESINTIISTDARDLMDILQKNFLPGHFGHIGEKGTGSVEERKKDLRIPVGSIPHPMEIETFPVHRACSFVSLGERER